MKSRWRPARSIAGQIAGLRGRQGILWFLTGLVALVAVTGIARLRFDDELVRFFDSDIPAFREYVALGRAFEGDANDVVALVEADDLADPKVVSALSDFILDAQFVPNVRAVLSPFALRMGNAPLFPYPPLPREQMASRLDKAWGQNPLLARMMARDRKAALLLFPISEPHDEAQAARERLLGALEALAAKAQEKGGVKIRFSGYPVLRDEVARALMHDIVVLNIVGVLVGFAVAALTLRSIRLAVLTMPGPVLSVAFGIGLHGHLGVNINSITITLPVLILVLATSDAIHISFERGRQGGRNSNRATMRAIRRVAVPCVFASVTTAIAFAALASSKSEIISEMGWMGVLLTMAAAFIVLLTQAVVLTAAGHTRWAPRLFSALHDRPPTALGLGWLPRLGMRFPRTVSWMALLVLALSTVAYSQASPRYSLLNSLRGASPVKAVFEEIEAKVSPASQLQIVVNSTDRDKLARVAGVVTRVTGSPYVQSLAELPEGARAADQLPGPLAQRMISRDGRQALVSVPFRYADGEATIALADRISEALKNEPGLEPGDIVAITGLPIMSARVARVILNEINRSLLIALFGVGLLIFIWLRDLRIALISLLPNMLPVTLIGGWLMVSGAGIEFANALALTVAFGVAVDDTLHVLNRLALVGAIRRITREGLSEAFREVTPALVTTSVVLFLGMSGGHFAQNTGVAEFAAVATSVLVLALVADLLVLPAALATFGPHSYLRKREEQS